MKYAVIEDSGTQIKVSEGDVIDVDLRPLGDDQADLTFDRVLVVGDPEGEGEPNLGSPHVAGATVTADILDEGRGPKIEIIKFKRRKGYTRRNGHRQGRLRVKITGISG